MTRSPSPHLEIETLEEFDRQILGARELANWTIQSIDLSGREKSLTQVNPAGALFLGVTMSEHLEDYLREHGALVFPRFPALAFNPYRSTLYTAPELYDAIGNTQRYADTFDAKVYAWFHSFSDQPPIPASLAMCLHDHAMSDALDEFCANFNPHKTVGIMGGHGIRRDEDDYRNAAKLASQLGEHNILIMTGGGPGAMEAANLGARLAGQQTALSHAIEKLSQTPTYTGQITSWAASALEIVSSTHASGASLSVPTWFYGHEPPNAFGSEIAKYFSNAVREDILLQRCQGGLIYLPGAAGTVQEVFQAATRNYYAVDESLVSPMILVGTNYWTNCLPVWKLLSQLAHGRVMSRSIHLVDTVNEAAKILLDNHNA